MFVGDVRHLDNRALANILQRIGDDWKERINPTSDTYCLINMRRACQAYGYPTIVSRYSDRKFSVVVPLKEGALRGVGFEVDGMEFSDYVQLDSGIAIPPDLARITRKSGREYLPHDRMILIYPYSNP